MSLLLLHKGGEMCRRHIASCGTIREVFCLYLSQAEGASQGSLEITPRSDGGEAWKRDMV
jgi:hypothetical protein